MVEKFLSKFELKIQAEIAKIDSKFDAQVQAYERKGVNPLTKKLMDKARNEQAKAVAQRREELEQEKNRTIDKIKAGLYDVDTMLLE